MEAGAILLFLVVLVFATFWLGLYCYFLYQAGRRIADKYRVRFTPKVAAILFALAGCAIAAPFALLELDVIYKTCLIFGVWLIHAEPVSVGYWAGSDIGRGADLERWDQTTDEWLAEWEEGAPSCMKNWEE